MSKQACMRTRSPNFMKPVRISPRSIFSITRRSAIQAEPAARDTLLTVPEPTMVPAVVTSAEDVGAYFRELLRRQPR